MDSICIVLFLLSCIFVGDGGFVHTKIISQGSSLSPTTKPLWFSPSGHFAFGFYKQGNGFAVGILLVATVANETTVVWTANRDDAPVPSNSQLVFIQGKLLLRSTDHEKPVANMNTTRPALFASMLDSGNFVLYSESYDVIWESFGYPTDTILGNQTLFSGGQLFSSLSESDHSTGRFRLKMQGDGNLVLYPVNTEDHPEDAYWSSYTWRYGPNPRLHFNSSGILSISNGTNYRVIVNWGESMSSNLTRKKNYAIIYRATLGADGNFRLYSHTYEEGKASMTNLQRSALDNPCEVKGFCGLNSYCTVHYEANYSRRANCLCIPGTEFADLDRKTLGCLRNYSMVGCSSDGKENTTFYNITVMKNILWEDVPYMEEKMSMENCSKSCFEDCNCGAAQYVEGSCLKQQLPLRFGRVVTDMYGGNLRTAFFKVGKKSSNQSELARELKVPNFDVISRKKDLVRAIALVLGLILLTCIALVISGFYIFKIRVIRCKRLRANGMNTSTDDKPTLRVFSYNDLKRATNGFKQELGRGSFGAVYKGTLNRGREVVAVKRLHEKLPDEGERDFRAEMRTIGRTNHKNLVRLLGFCLEDSKRLLVYEYMSNGSLADFLFKNDGQRPDWDERVKIAIDVAKGILYLHEECKRPIIHCDIKPQNILMDDFWTAKISDFGLAKLLMPDQTRASITRVRGTRGYLAPEWHKNTAISFKVDVYSYGIVLLEIVCCRRNLDVNVSDPEDIVLANWVYKCFSSMELNKLVIGEEADKKMLDNMVKVALWCIQDEPALRPSMKSVVLMLEGITDVSIPPCPTST